MKQIVNRIINDIPFETIEKITKKIWTDTRKMNIAFQKSEPELNMRTGNSLLTGFFWHCWDSMPKNIKEIHLLRTQLLIEKKGNQSNKKGIHSFFVNERIKAGWVLGDVRRDFFSRTDGRVIGGTDPFLKPFSLLSEAGQLWLLRKNAIAANTYNEAVRMGLIPG